MHTSSSARPSTVKFSPNWPYVKSSRPQLAPASTGTSRAGTRTPRAARRRARRDRPARRRRCSAAAPWRAPHRRLPDGRVHRPAAPGHVLRHADVHRSQRRRHPPHVLSNHSRPTSPRRSARADPRKARRPGTPPRRPSRAAGARLPCRRRSPGKLRVTMTTLWSCSIEIHPGSCPLDVPARHRLRECCPPCRCTEGVREVLRLVHHLLVSKFHDGD